jgi:Skp family chaperone for outer membrane proteins
LFAAALVAPLTAQPKTPAVVKAVEATRVAYINSSAFLDPATGIKQLVKVVQGLELEFSNTQGELSLLGEKLRTLSGELNKLNADPVTNAKLIAEKQAEGQRLQQELQTKQQAAQEAYGKRAQETQGPVATEIGKELRAFAKERDIDLLFDIAKMGDILLHAKAELDLTPEFIGYYNGKHP